MSDEQRKRLAELRAAETDPIQREAYALVERAGFDWYNTESNARRMAEYAASELVPLKRQPWLQKDNAVESILAFMKTLTPQERVTLLYELEFESEFCWECGYVMPKEATCHCMNDD